MGTDMHMVDLRDDAVAPEINTREATEPKQLTREEMVLLRELERMLSPRDFELLCDVLRRAGYEVRSAATSPV